MCEKQQKTKKDVIYSASAYKNKQTNTFVQIILSKGILHDGCVVETVHS
jgi:hypothetical protein